MCSIAWWTLFEKMYVPMMARLPAGVFGFSMSLVMFPFLSSWAMPKQVGSSTSLRIIRASSCSFLNFCTKFLMPCPVTLSPRHMMNESWPRKGWAVLTAWAKPSGSWGMYVTFAFHCLPSVTYSFT